MLRRVYCVLFVSVGNLAAYTLSQMTVQKVVQNSFKQLASVTAYRYAKSSSTASPRSLSGGCVKSYVASATSGFSNVSMYVIVLRAYHCPLQKMFYGLANLSGGSLLYASFVYSDSKTRNKLLNKHGHKKLRQVCHRPVNKQG